MLITYLLYACLWTLMVFPWTYGSSNQQTRRQLNKTGCLTCGVIGVCKRSRIQCSNDRMPFGDWMVGRHTKFWWNADSSIFCCPPRLKRALDVRQQPAKRFIKRNTVSRSRTATGKRTSRPATGKRTSRPATGKRTSRPASRKRTSRPASRKRTTRPATRKPTTRPATKKPTTRPATKKPTTRPATKKPTTRPLPMRITVSQCGRSPVRSTTGDSSLLRFLKRQRAVPLVVGGNNAPPEKWPWMGLIFLKADTGRQNPICGASLISERTLLTAAHCFLGRNSSELVVRLGEHDLKSRNDSRQRLELEIEKVIQHEEFHYPSLYHDVAVMLLKSKVTLLGNIQTVCIPEDLKKEDFVGKFATITGWGLLQFGGKQATILQELKLPVISNEECTKKYQALSGSKVNLPKGIAKSMMCAGFDKEVKDSCQGDSGGPLVYEKSPGIWSQVGIVSAGFECGSGIPGLYTRVTSYLGWIKMKMI